MSYNKLARTFPDQKLVRFISTTRDCPLSLKERWVYSTLLWRFKGKPVTKSRLARWTGVDRTRTLPRILTRLGNLRLVVNADRKYRAVEPPSERMPWFATYIRGIGPTERLVPSYNWAVYIRSRDIIDNLVACADALGHHAAAKLARRFGVCGKTITAARRRLQAAAQTACSVEPMQSVLAVNPPVGVVPVQPVPAVREVPAPIPEISPDQRLAAQYADHLHIEPEATKQIARLCRLLNGLASKEIGQVVTAMVARFGVGEGLEDAVFHFIHTHRLRYFTGASLEQVMADIGSTPSGVDDDDLSMVGDVGPAFASAV